MVIFACAWPQVWRGWGGFGKVQCSGSGGEDAGDHGGLPGGHEEPQPGLLTQHPRVRLLLHRQR